MKTVAIVGTGLIGASFGLALRKAGFQRADPGRQFARARSKRRWRPAPSIARHPLAEAAAQADLIFLSQPIGRILDTIRHLDPLVRPDALVTDAGSTKCEIVGPGAAANYALPVSGRPSHGRQGEARRGGGRRGPVPRPHLGADAGRAAELDSARPASSRTGWHASAPCRWSGAGRARPRRVAHVAPAATGVHGAGRHRGRKPAAAASGWR